MYIEKTGFIKVSDKKELDEIIKKIQPVNGLGVKESQHEIKIYLTDEIISLFKDIYLNEEDILDAKGCDNIIFYTS